MQSRCPRCGAELTADAAGCPACAYGDVEDIVLLEAHVPGAPRPEPSRPVPPARVLVPVAFLVVVLVAIFVALV